LNPFWPDHWTHTARELATVLGGRDRPLPGAFRGFEWVSLSGRDFLRFAFFPLAVWSVLLLRQLGRREPIRAPTIAGVIATLGLLGASLLSAKFLPLFLLASALFVPRVVIDTGPWSKVWAIAAVLTASVTLGSSFYVARRDLLVTTERLRPADYSAMAATLRELAPPGQMVVAPWDDFPGLFLFDRENRYVVGMNPEFLRWASEAQYRAYVLLYEGRVRDPENLLPSFFDDARLVLARREPRRSGERELLRRLGRNRRFSEIETSTPWRVFRLVSEPDPPGP
jgi:hypothetical protein